MPTLNRTRPKVVVMVLLSLFAIADCGCSAGEKSSDASGHADYVFVYLKTGPAADKTPEERQEIFRGHMSNMQRLAEAGKLIIAGPFNKPTDPTWRGIFVMDTPTVAEARALVATDPGVQSGVFIVECRPFRASPALRTCLELDKEMRKTQAPPQKPGEPPANIRGYVMITSRDALETSRSLAKSAFADKILWCGLLDPDRKTDRLTTAGVFVIDAADVADLKPALPQDAFAGSLDGWWSTTSLTQLPAAARSLP